MQTHANLPLNWAPINPVVMESFWVLAQRFMIRNVLSPYEFCSRFRRQELRGKSVAGIHVYERLDLDSLAPYLGHTPASIRLTLPMAWEIGLRGGTHPPLKLCLECAEQGYHTALFETGWLSICPIHNRLLLSRCPECRRKLRHISWKRFGPAPGLLPCGHTWSGVSIRDKPELDASSVRRLSDWVRRFKQPGTEETWFGVSLHGESALRQDNQDFVEFVDCVAAIAGLGTYRNHRLAFWMRRFRAMKIQCTSSANLRPDWFDATLQRLSRYVAILGLQPWDERLGHFQRADDALRHLRAIGLRQLIKAVRRRACLLPLCSPVPAPVSLDDRYFETIAAALVQKHLLSSWNSRHQFESSQDFLDFLCRFSGAPLGCFRYAHGTLTAFWIEQVPLPKRLAQANSNTDRE